MMEGSAFQCLQALLGMSIGFVLSYVIAHYVRKARHNKLLQMLRRQTEEPEDSVSDDNIN